MRPEVHIGLPKTPKRPSKPLMKLARPSIEEMTRRLQKMDPDERKQQLLIRAKSWPRIVAGKTKEEIKEVRMQAGEMLVEFNRRWSDEDGGGPIRTS
jgi:hypothetical protein